MLQWFDMRTLGVGRRRPKRVLHGVGDSSLLGGLSETEAVARLRQFGPNTIRKKKEVRSLSILLAQLRSPLIYILLVAAVITFLLGDYVDTAVIGLAVFVNTILGFYQEYKAQRALIALRELLSPKATVVRDGRRASIEAWQVVPGDHCLVGLGERIPADGVVIAEDDFSVTEAILTGESLPVHKNAVSARSFEEGDIEETRRRWVMLAQEVRVFAGTIVASGTATVMVVATGSESEVGKIAETLVETREEATPLQKRIRHLSNRLALLVGISATLIFLVGILAGKSFLEIFTTSVAVAVSAIPEGLAVSLTAILALSMQRILRQKALVRKLMAAETLGSVTVICVDKTGTLTEGVMRVTRADFVNEDEGVLAAVYTNDQRDPLEIAMWEWVHETYGKDPQQMIDANRRLDSIPFSPREKFSAKLTEKGVYVVGAPEVVLAFSDLTVAAKRRWMRKFDEYGYLGYRLVGFAFRRRRPSEYRLTKRSVKRGLTFLGILIYDDPIREGVEVALAEARKAGIKVKVVTGDYRATAEAVLERLKLLTHSEKLASPHPLVLEGGELETLTVEELRGRVEHTVLFARIDPVQKLKIVEALQENGEVVAVTGDGVNDAPALKRANIGIVVSGATDVAKETADIVLLDDDFATIVAAVEEGRVVFENLRKVILYLLSDAFAEVFIILVSIGLQLPLPITAAQILWVNLIGDGLPNLALTVEPKEPHLLKQKPRPSDAPLVDSVMKTLLVLVSAVTAVVVLGIFLLYFPSVELEYARTMAFTVLSTSSLLYVFSTRSLQKPVWREGFFKNRWLVGAVVGGMLLQLSAIYLPILQDIFHTRPLRIVDWVVVLLAGLLVMVVIETTKWRFLRKG